MRRSLPGNFFIGIEPFQLNNLVWIYVFVFWNIFAFSNTIIGILFKPSNKIDTFIVELFEPWKTAVASVKDSDITTFKGIDGATFCSCTLPVVTIINVRQITRMAQFYMKFDRSFVVRNFAQLYKERHKSIVLASILYTSFLNLNLCLEPRLDILDSIWKKIFLKSSFERCSLDRLSWAVYRFDSQMI